MIPDSAGILSRLYGVWCSSSFRLMSAHVDQLGRCVPPLVPTRRDPSDADRPGRSSLTCVPLARRTAPLAPCRDERCRPARAVRLRPGRLPLGQGDVPDERRAGAERCGAAPCQHHALYSRPTASHLLCGPAVCWPIPELGDAEVDLGTRWRLGQALWRCVKPPKRQLAEACATA